jgi:hypothetical protein
MKVYYASWIFPLGGTNLPKLSWKSEELHLFSQKEIMFLLCNLWIHTIGTWHSKVHPKVFMHQLVGVRLQQRDQDKKLWLLVLCIYNDED